MDETDQRNLSRDSLFVLASLRLMADGVVQRVRVRNVSAGGLMAESNLRVARGQRLEVELRQIGWVAGVVAWVQDTRFGVAFDQEIDPAAARAAPSVQSVQDKGFYARGSLAAAAQRLAGDPSRLRKI